MIRTKKYKQTRKSRLSLTINRPNLNAVGGSQLKYAACITLISGIATNSITAISRILSPKFNIFKVFRAFSRQSSATTLFTTAF